MSLRELKRERTRQSIVDTAFRLFAERGFDGVTVAEIAAAAEVGTRTLHRYFTSKEELVFPEDDDLRADLTRLLAERPEGEHPETTLAVVITPLISRFGGEQLVQARTRDALITSTPALQARDLAKQAAVEKLIEHHLARQLGVAVDSDVRPALWAKIGMACFFSAYRVWLHEGGDLAQHLIDARTALTESVPRRT
ncbi:TetR family transcriptional regulator [Nocardia sp. XZ_19_231]|uniref:TetR family transcriptional regulator n=1 Tax=Nocardia sp. XZ_19_231 TaxID=2769252 RepID=UPI00188E9215|nr:TetR family transcriptional regulator [Nocardia sp. XZ_19_231]